MSASIILPSLFAFTTLAVVAIRSGVDGEPPLDVPPIPERNGAMRVALFSGNYNCVKDGANGALNRLVRQLVDVEGVQVRVYSPVTEPPAFEPAGDLVGVPSMAIPGRPEYRLAYGLPSIIRDDLEAFAPDVVHLSAPDLLGRSAQAWARDHKVPVVTSLHTRFESYFSYYGLKWLRSGAERWLQRFYRRSDRVLVPTRQIMEEMRAAGMGSDISLWTRGVDHQLFNPARRDLEWRQAHGYADDEPVILFFGRLVREKGIGIFAAAIDRLRQLGHPVRPLVVGDGPDRDMFARILPNSVFTGHLAGEELARAVASADIFLGPSLTEAFGNVTLEAMACGVVPVCPDVGSTRDLVEHGKTGLLLPSPDDSAYADALSELLQSPDRLKAMGEAAVKASRTHDWVAVNHAVVETYEQVLTRVRNAQPA